MCVDANPSQLVSAVRQPLPVAPGQPRRYDDEYRRAGTGNLCMFFEPRQGWRPVKVPHRRTPPDLADGLKDLVDVHVPRAAVMRFVLENLNPHTPGAL